MNKKILISLSVIAAVAAIVVGGTIAYFSDVETSTGNTLTAGVLDIELDDSDEPFCAKITNPEECEEYPRCFWGEDRKCHSKYDSVTGSFTVSDLKPCVWQDLGDIISIHVKDGSNPADVYVDYVVGTGSGGVMSEPECVAEKGKWVNGACVGNTPVDNIEDMIEVVLTLDGKPIYEGMLTEIEELDLGEFQPSEVHWIDLEVHLLGDAGNEYQGDTTTVDFTFRADQVGLGD